MGSIVVDSVSKTFRGRHLEVAAVADVSLRVDDGEFVTVIGPSGCGKSTLFNMVAGLVHADSGRITYAGREPSGNGAPDSARAPDTAAAHVGYMPQKDLLLPWLRVIDNAGLPMELAGTPRARARALAQEQMEEFGLDGFEFAWPRELSGGMRQRAALLRTVMTGRDILLLDEPFGALDALTRREMQTWLLGLHRRLARTILFITHDVDEAVYLSDRVVVLSQRPARVVREIKVPLPRPRGFHMVESAEFGHTVATILSDLGLE